MYSASPSVPTRVAIATLTVERNELPSGFRNQFSSWLSGAPQAFVNDRIVNTSLARSPRVTRRIAKATLN